MRRHQQPVQHPQGEPSGPWALVLVRDVLGEHYAQDPGRHLDDEAAAVATGLRGIRYDWCGRPCLSWADARSLLESLQAERRRVLTERAEREARADAKRMGQPGIIQMQRPGIPAGG